MKLISLTQGEFAKVDDEDFDYLNQWKWYCSIERSKKYANRRQYIKGEGKSKTLKMHRVLLGLTNPKELCDHKDGNGLNNQRGNIRKATPQENLRNRGKGKLLTSKYKGVHKRYINNKPNKYTYWTASITINGKEKILGYFKYTEEGEILAAKAYDEAAKKYHGEFANLNFK